MASQKLFIVFLLCIGENIKIEKTDLISKIHNNVDAGNCSDIGSADYFLSGQAG